MGTVARVLPLLDGASQDALEELADEPPPGSLMVLSCPLPGLAEEAARLLGRRSLGAVAARSDLAVFRPESDAWSVSEVSAVVSRLSVMPLSRHFLVMCEADRLEARAADRLLKILEEPPAPSTVVLVCARESSLPATLLGRSSARLALASAPVDEQVAALVSSGASVSAAREAVSLAGSRLEWSQVLAGSSELRAVARRALAPRLGPDAPVSEATSRLSAASVLARAFLSNSAEVDASAVFESLSPQEKVLARRVLREFAAARRAALTRALGSLGDDGVVAVSRAFDALDRFELRLSGNVPAFLALAALGCESPPVRLPRSLGAG